MRVRGHGHCSVEVVKLTLNPELSAEEMLFHLRHKKTKRLNNHFRFMASVGNLKLPAVFLKLREEENTQTNAEISLVVETGGGGVPDTGGILVPGH